MTFDRSIIDAPVFLLGMPRSGTTWLSQIFEYSPEVLMRLSPNYSYPLKNMLDENSSRADWEAQLTAALDTDDPFMTHNWRREKGELEWIDKNSESVRILFVKDTRFHSLYLNGMRLFPKSKCLYVVRNPCGQLNSWRKSPEFPKDVDFSQDWRHGLCRKSEGPGEYWGFEDWKKLTRTYLDLQEREPDRYTVFRYEDLVADPVGCTRRLFEFVGLELHDDVVSFLSRSHSSHNPSVYSVFRTPDVADKWRSEFPADLRQCVYDDLVGSDLERFLN